MSIKHKTVLHKVAATKSLIDVCEELAEVHASVHELSIRFNRMHNDLSKFVSSRNGSIKFKEEVERYLRSAEDELTNLITSVSDKF